MAYRPGDPILDPDGGVNLKKRRDEFMARYPGATPTDNPATLQGQPGVTFDVITGISVDRREIPQGYMDQVRFFYRATKWLKEAEKFAASCDAVDDRSGVCPCNID